MLGFTISQLVGASNELLDQIGNTPIGSPQFLALVESLRETRARLTAARAALRSL